MAYVDPLHPHQSAIVELLATRPAMTVTQLHKELNISGPAISLPSIYRLLGQLLDMQVLVKEKGKLSLNAVWVSHFVRFADSARRSYLQGEKSTVTLPEHDGEKREFFAESLGTLDPLWNHIIRKVADVESGRDWYEYNAHTYHLLGMTQTEQRLYESLGIGHKLYGNETFLDRYGVQLNPDGQNVVVTSNTPFPKEGYSLWLCGDYIVDCVFPDVLSKHFSFFFRTVQSIDQFHPELFADIFRMKAHCRLLVWKSKKECGLLRSKFLPYFPRRKTQSSDAA